MSLDLGNWNQSRQIKSFWDGEPTNLGLIIWKPLGLEDQLTPQICTGYSPDTSWHRLCISIAVTIFHLVHLVQVTAAWSTFWNHLPRPCEFLQMISKTCLTPSMQDRWWEAGVVMFWMLSCRAFWWHLVLFSPQVLYHLLSWPVTLAQWGR